MPEFGSIENGKSVHPEIMLPFLSKMHYFFESLLVGFGVMLLGLLLSSGGWLFWERRLPDSEGYFRMGAVLFLTGMLFHMLSEWNGINLWYCHFGSACASKSG